MRSTLPILGVALLLVGAVGCSDEPTAKRDTDPTPVKPKPTRPNPTKPERTTTTESAPVTIVSPLATPLDSPFASPFSPPMVFVEPPGGYRTASRQGVFSTTPTEASAISLTAAAATWETKLTPEQREEICVAWDSSATAAAGAMIDSMAAWEMGVTFDIDAVLDQLNMACANAMPSVFYNQLPLASGGALDYYDTMEELDFLGANGFCSSVTALFDVNLTVEGLVYVAREGGTGIDIDRYGAKSWVESAYERCPSQPAG